MDAFVFRRSGTTYHLVRASDAAALRERATFTRVPATEAAWLLQTHSRDRRAAAQLTDYLLRESDGFVGGVDRPARREQLAQLMAAVRAGDAGTWQLYARAPTEAGVLVELSDALLPAQQPDQTFGWIELDLLDQNDLPIAGVPWAIELGDERVRGGTLNAQGNAYADGIEPGTYKVVMGRAAVAEPVEPTSWLGIELYDDFGLPVPGEPYRVVDSAGDAHEGVLDQSGRGMLMDLPPGACEVTFTRLDAQAWAVAETYLPAPPPTRARAPEPVTLPAPPPREFDDGAGARKDRAYPIAAAHFQFDSAFPGADTFEAIDKMHAASEAVPAGRLVVFGHADQQGSDDYNKRLSDRRARAVLALLTQDLERFDAVAKEDEWRLIHYQAMLGGLGITPIEADDVSGPQTKAATKKFQQEYNENTYHPDGGRARAYPALGEDGVLGDKTKRALRDAYLAKAKKQIAVQRFAGPKLAGCGEFNALSYDAAVNRRVSLAVFEGAAPKDKDFPCKEGDAKKCPVDITQPKSLDAKKRVPPKFRCPFYRRHVEESFETQSAGSLLSLVARERLTTIAREQSEEQFTRWLTSVFGEDIPQARYAVLCAMAKDETLPHPPIVLTKGASLRGRDGAYNRMLQRIEVSADLVDRATTGDPDAAWLLLAVLIEEFGHYLDDWLREGNGDAALDEGARFGYAMVALDSSPTAPATPFATYIDPGGTEYPVVVAWSDLRAQVEVVFDEEAQRADDRDSHREYFGPVLAADRLQAGAQLAMSGAAADRVSTMNGLGPRFGVPVDAWASGQSRLFVDGDVRIVSLLRVLSKAQASKAAAVNLSRAQRHTGMDPYLTLTTAARENDRSVTARGSNMIDTWRDGGLDFLWKNKARLGLPVSITSKWEEVPAFTSPETGNEVHPGLIPARDQVLGYAAQTKLSYAGFERFVLATLGDAAGQAALAELNPDARVVWQAYAFLAPGGNPFDPAVGIQHGQKFGVKPAFQYMLHEASKAGREVDLNQVVLDAALDGTDYVRIAKARAVEAAFLGHYVAAATGGP